MVVSATMLQVPSNWAAIASGTAQIIAKAAVKAKAPIRFPIISVLLLLSSIRRPARSLVVVVMVLALAPSLGLGITLHSRLTFRSGSLGLGKLIRGGDQAGIRQTRMSENPLYAKPQGAESVSPQQSRRSMALARGR